MAFAILGVSRGRRGGLLHSLVPEAHVGVLGVGASPYAAAQVRAGPLGGAVVDGPPHRVAVVALRKSVEEQ